MENSANKRCFNCKSSNHVGFECPKDEKEYMVYIYESDDNEGCLEPNKYYTAKTGKKRVKREKIDK